MKKETIRLPTTKAHKRAKNALDFSNAYVRSSSLGSDARPRLKREAISMPASALASALALALALA